MNEVEDQSIRLEQHVDVPVERAFEAWNNPRELEQWAWGSLGVDARADVDFRTGGTFVVSTAGNDGERMAFSGVYTEVEPNRRIAHTLVWDAEMGYDAIPESVAVEFAEGGEGTGTTILFTHHGAFDERSRKGHTDGWRNVLETLKRYLEQTAG